MPLHTQKCVSCELGGVPLTKDEVSHYSKEVPQWTVSTNHKKISRVFKFKDFKESLEFVNKVGVLAESEGHHPDFIINYNVVTFELWTHAVGGLSINDFILAAKIDR